MTYDHETLASRTTYMIDLLRKLMAIIISQLGMIEKPYIT
jgi:hypothetical protein